MERFDPPNPEIAIRLAHAEDMLDLCDERMQLIELQTVDLLKSVKAAVSNAS